MANTRSQLQPAVLLFLISVLLFLFYGCDGDETRSVLVFSTTTQRHHPSAKRPLHDNPSSPRPVIPVCADTFCYCCP